MSDNFSTLIETEGYCINNFIDKIRSSRSYAEADKLKRTAIEIVENCVDVYSKSFGSSDVGATGTGTVAIPYKDNIPNSTTGLIYGKVQSGKTETTIASLALAEANKFRCFIVLTSDNTWLGKQTANRFKNQLEGGPVVYDWDEWRRDPIRFGNDLRDYIDDTGVVLVSTKNVHHLENLLSVLRSANAQCVPGLIFDDEADNASLNTNEAKQAKRGKHSVPDSSIFDLIGQIRKLIPNHIYLQITATPQSLLLQSLKHPCSPAFCVLSKPGDAYMGGDLFFEPSSQHCCTVESEELEQLKGGQINPGNSWDIPVGLRLALCCFFLGAVYKMLSLEGKYATYSFLAHICHKRINHENLEEVIRRFVVDLDKAIRGKLSTTKKEQALKWLNAAHAELKKTVPDLPSLDYLVTELQYKLRNAIPEVINADNPNQQPQYKPGMNILIGGNRLGRGVTIDGLMITYYGRDPKQKMMDTVHQHARMFGYRRKLEDVTRLFLPQHILEDFRAIHESDEGMRQAIGDDPNKNIQVKPIWIGRQLKPTRANVLNPAEIRAFSPGVSIFPRNPFWKAAEVREHTQTLNKLLNKYDGDDKYHEIDIDFLIEILSYMPSSFCVGHLWEDKRVAEVLKSMKVEGIRKAMLNVRRGKKGEGLDLTNQFTRPWQGSGFAQSRWLSEPKQKYPNFPTLVVMYEKGERVRNWDGQPLYLPTLVMPKHNFVFMFNYSE